MAHGDERESNRRIVARWLRRALPWVLIAGAAYLLLAQLAGSASLTEGSAAPELRAPLAGGGTFDLADREGAVTVLNFWATWCPPCRAEAPELSRAHERIRDRDAIVVGVSADRMPLDRLGTSARRLGMRYPIAQGSGTVMERYEVRTLPTTYVIGRDGRIAWSTVGRVTERDVVEAVEAALD